MARDARCRPETTGNPEKVVILGPGRSDAVPALWFHLAVLDGDAANDGPRIRPSRVSTSASWSMLDKSAKIGECVGRAKVMNYGKMSIASRKTRGTRRRVGGDGPSR